MSVLLRWSLTGLALALLLCFADFTHSIADTGMDFVSVNEVGHMEPVLILSKEKRNTKRPYETAGDPFLTRTDPDFLVRNKTVAEHLLNNDTESVIESRRQSQLTESYLTAVSLIVRDGVCSFFISFNESTTSAQASFFNVLGFRVDYVPGDYPLCKMTTELPLNCSDSEMTHIQQRLPAGSFKGTTLDISAQVPNCTFRGRRESGFYGEDELGSAKILETAFVPFSGKIEVSLSNGTGNVRGSGRFYLSHEDKRLARDRPDWRKGRRVTAFDTLVIDNTSIELGALVIASSEIQESYTFGSASNNVQRDTKYYGLIAEILGPCPPRPSGLAHDDTVCLTLVSIWCDPFLEDESSFYNEVYSLRDPSECSMLQLGIVWGRAFLGRRRTNRFDRRYLRSC